LTNAARVGARISISQPDADLTLSNPGTVQATRDAVVTYLNNSNLPATLSSTSPCASGPFTWTYCLNEADGSGNPGQIKIDRPFVFLDSSGTNILSSKITVTYPFSWSFAQIIQLLVPGASYATSFMISSDAIMEDLG
ncbi:MAG: hypothetical protein ACE5Q6_24775, partial [Dehalococcoidia bacterium]